MQTREKPPVVVHPDVAHLMNGPMIEIRDVIVDQACRVAQDMKILVDQIVIREFYDYEEEWSRIIFEICISADDETPFTYWEAVTDAVWDDQVQISKVARATLDDDVSVFVHW